MVLPSSYRVVFSTLAKKHNVDIGAENIRSEEEISDEVLNHIISLDSNTTNAIEAIKQKDEESLNLVLEETRKLKEELHKLQHEAYEDSLTQTLNRKWLSKNYFHDESENFIKDGVLVIIDLDDFKHINDTYGHAVGDQVLVKIAESLKDIEGDVIRYGGDEFIIMINHKNHTNEEVNSLMQVIRELQMKKQFKTKNAQFKVSFSYGISSYSANSNFKDALEDADKKLYIDKEKIKDRLTL